MALADLQVAASAAWGPDAWWHPGGLAWTPPLSTGRIGQTYVWSDGDVVSVLGEVTAGVAAWAHDGGAHLLVDHRQLELPVVADAVFSLDVRRTAQHLEPPAVEGIRLGSVEDESSFVACHRDAWAPRSLPFATPRSIPAGGGSTFDGRRWGMVRSNRWFDADLVAVAYDDHDEPVGSCIVWYDESSRSAEIEPPGVTPAARGRGIAKSLTIEAIRRVSDRGADEVVVHPRGDDDYPVPRAVYASCGFVTRRRDHLYRLDG